MASSSNHFSRLISPIETDEFFADYWEQKPLFISRQEPDYFQYALKAESIETYLVNRHITPGFLRVFKSGEACPREDWTFVARNVRNKFLERLVDVRKLLAFFNDGATIAIQSCETAIPSLVELRHTLESEFKCFVQANIYITPAGSYCFDPHYDAHNVFVLQIYGSKKWDLYDSPYKNPIASVPIDSMGYKKREPAQTISIKAGDLLYVPRGMVHNVSAEDDSSIHITLSPLVSNWTMLIKELGKKAEKDENFRRLLPHGFSSTEEQQVFVSDFTDQVQSLIAEMDLKAMQHSDFLDGHRGNSDGILMDSLKVKELSANSVVCRRPYINYSIERTDEWIAVRFAEEEIILPLFMDRGLDKFFKDESFAVSEIEGIPNEAGKVAMVKRFVKAGFLRIVSV